MENTVENTKVTKPGVMKAVKTGLKFVFTPDKELMGMLGWYALLSLLLSVLGWKIGGNTGEWTQALLMIVVQLPVTVWAIEKTLTGKGDTKFFDWYSKDMTWRVLGAILLASLLLAVPLLVLVGGMLVLMGGVNLADMMHVETLLNLPHLGESVMVLIGLLILVTLFLAVRLSFVAAFTVDTHKVSVLGAFHTTRGVFWRLVGVMLLTGLVAFGVLFVLGVILGLLGVGLALLSSGMPVGVLLTTTLAKTVQTWMMLGVTVGVVTLYMDKKMLEG